MRVSCSTPPLPSRTSPAAITTRLLCPIDWADLHCSGAQTPNTHEIHRTIPADERIRLFFLCPYLTPRVGTNSVTVEEATGDRFFSGLSRFRQQIRQAVEKAIGLQAIRNVDRDGQVDGKRLSVALNNTRLSYSRTV